MRGKNDPSQFNGFLKCFDTVGWVILPVKIVPKMTYNALSGMSSPYACTHVLTLTVSYFSLDYTARYIIFRDNY